MKRFSTPPLKDTVVYFGNKLKIRAGWSVWPKLIISAKWNKVTPEKGLLARARNWGAVSKFPNPNSVRKWVVWVELEVWSVRTKKFDKTFKAPWLYHDGGDVLLQMGTLGVVFWLVCQVSIASSLPVAQRSSSNQGKPESTDRISLLISCIITLGIMYQRRLLLTSSLLMVLYTEISELFLYIFSSRFWSVKSFITLRWIATTL